METWNDGATKVLTVDTRCNLLEGPYLPVAFAPTTNTRLAADEKHTRLEESMVAKRDDIYYNKMKTWKRVVGMLQEFRWRVWVWLFGGAWLRHQQ